MKMMAKLLVGSASMGLCVALATPSFAQANDPAASPPAGSDEAAASRAQAAGTQYAAADENDGSEIIVTAQKRNERLLDVPISITTLNAAELEARNITDLSKLAAYTPGLEVTPSPSGGAGLTVRGVTTGVGGVGVDPSVGVYVDDVYISRDWVALQSYLDIDRVEVLRGPQGTLYGRNTTGGAYNIYHKRPTKEWEAGASAEYASYDRQRYEGYVSGPIAGDGILARIAVARDSADEFGKNLVNGKRLRAIDTWQGVGTLELHPTDNLTVTLRGDYMKDNGTVGAVYHVVRPGTANSTANLPDSPYRYRADFITDGNYLRNHGWSANIDWQLGDYQLRSITGGRSIRINTEYDTDSTELPIYTAVLNDQSRTISQEFQIVSPTGGKFDWILGAYYYQEKAHDLTTTGGPYPYGPFFSGLYRTELNPAPAYVAINLNIPFDNRGVFDSRNVTNSYAAFGQARYKFTDKLQATVGLRYTQEKRTFDGTAGTTFVGINSGFYAYNPATACHDLVAANTVTYPIGLTPAQAEAICVANVNNDIAIYSSSEAEGRSQQSLKFHNLSERFALDYYPSPDTHIYATATSGFKSGGFNSYDTDAAYGGSQPGNPGVPVIAFQPPFGPEHLWSYEVGIKGRLFGKALQYSLDAFYYNWSNIQSQIYNYTNATSSITSDAKAHAMGIELDLLATPWKGGSVDFAGAWIDSEYTHFGSNIDDVVTGATNQDFTGTSLPGSPKWKWSLGVQHTVPVGNIGDVTLRGEWLHRSATFWVYTKDPIAKSGDYDLFNLRLTYRDPSTKFSAGVYVENLFDQYYDYYRYGASTTGVIAIVGRPRTAGVRLGVNF